MSRDILVRSLLDDIEAMADWRADQDVAVPLGELRAVRDELAGYRRALVAHHDMAHVSDAVLREYDFHECPVCRRARNRQEGKDG